MLVSCSEFNEDLKLFCKTSQWSFGQLLHHVEKPTITDSSSLIYINKHYRYRFRCSPVDQIFSAETADFCATSLIWCAPVVYFTGQLCDALSKHLQWLIIMNLINLIFKLFDVWNVSSFILYSCHLKSHLIIFCLSGLFTLVLSCASVAYFLLWWFKYLDFITEVTSQWQYWIILQWKCYWL